MGINVDKLERNPNCLLNGTEDVEKRPLVDDNKSGSICRNDRNNTQEFAATSKNFALRKFTFFFFILPFCLSLWYAAAILFPPEARSGGWKYVLWTDGELKENEDGVWAICPRPTICSEGWAELVLISLARLTAFASYVCMGLTFASKMHSSIHFLSSTYLALYLPFESLHKLHRKQGAVYGLLAFIHTITHLLRWGMRKELGDTKSGLSVPAISGYFAMFFMATVVLSMTLAKRLKSLGFEHRLGLHWLFVGVVAALCFHTERTRNITLSFGFLWFFDYLYGIIFRTHRLDIVEFSALPGGDGTQMLWRNPKGFQPKSGEFVQIKIPWLTEGGEQWHAFSLYMQEATEEGLQEIKRKESGRIYLGNDTNARRRGVDPTKTAVILIECQNEFGSPGGKLYNDVKGVLNSNRMTDNLAELAGVAREVGACVFHAPIIMKPDMSNCLNNGIGILKDVRDKALFVQDTWNANFMDKLMPENGDSIVKNKIGLDCFPGTDLETLLTEKGIETVILGGFLTNCCVESTMRTAYEKGLNVITLVDGTACKSKEEQRAATEGTFKMFSSPMKCSQATSILRGEIPKGLDDIEMEQEVMPIAGEHGDEPTLDEFIEDALLEGPREQESLTRKEARIDLSNRYNTTQVFMAAAGDWTKGLVNDLNTSKQQRACWVRGPYTSPYFVASEFSHLILTASGIGITPALGVMGQYPGSSRTKILVWFTKSREMLKFFAPLMRDAHMAFIFYTGKEKLTIVELKNLRDNGNIYIQQSRPKSLEATLSKIIVQYENIAALNTPIQAEVGLSNFRKSLYSYAPPFFKTTIPNEGTQDSIRHMNNVHPSNKAAWCVMYCGGAVVLKDTLKGFAKENGTGFSSELFDW